MANRRNDVVDFWKKVSISIDLDACWVWKGCCDSYGYGRMGWYGDKQERAHRIAFMITQGPIPEGEGVLHSCDNRPCCNPRHLRSGTDDDNIQDRLDRNRSARHIGIANPMAKLTENDVRQIRDALQWNSRPLIARAFHVSPACIDAIAWGRTWKHI